ncbi:MAG: lysophospholipid acyltransferase family protein [Sulfurovum sp.]|nr:lysophospholipid acyltransferase family protein [Sulfurovum sp.]
MKQRAEYYVIKFFLLLGKMLPKNFIYGLCRWIFKFYYWYKPKRVSIMHSNIKKGFPEKASKDIEKSGIEVYVQASRALAETILLYNNRLDIDSSIVNKGEAIARLEQTRSVSKMGILFITAHYANWELLGQFLGKHGFPVVNVTKDSSNSLIDDMLITPFRQRYGSKMLRHQGSVVSLAKTLKRNEIASLMIDQVVQPPNGVIINFFGHATTASKAIAVLKLKYNPLIVPIFITRVGFEKFEITINDSVEVELEDTMSKDEQIVIMTQKYMDIIEAQISKEPTQWLWLYNRWKRIKFEK